MLGEAMRRREFIKHLVSVAAAWPFAARAQRSGKPPTIGYVVPGPATTKSLHDEFLMQRLSQLGWVVGRDVVVEYRYAEASIDHAGEAMPSSPVHWSLPQTIAAESGVSRCGPPGED